jgi:hypothetical protein
VNLAQNDIHEQLSSRYQFDGDKIYFMPIFTVYPNINYVEINRCELLGENKDYIRYSGFFLTYNDPERFPTAEDRVFDFWFEIKLEDGKWKIYDAGFEDGGTRSISSVFTAMYLLDPWTGGLEAYME